MAKDYILSREDLKKVILGAKTFIAQRCREMLARGEDPTKLTYRQTDAAIEEYIDSLKEIKMEEVLDRVDEVLEKTTGINTRELLKRAQDN
jgi:seryl-tRNA(Sec) selenium transferase